MFVTEPVETAQMILGTVRTGITLAGVPHNFPIRVGEAVVSVGAGGVFFYSRPNVEGVECRVTTEGAIVVPGVSAEVSDAFTTEWNASVKAWPNAKERATARKFMKWAIERYNR